jgi:hypothetical protein
MAGFRRFLAAGVPVAAICGAMYGHRRAKLTAVLGEEALAGAVATLRALSAALDEIQPGV